MTCYVRCIRINIHIYQFLIMKNPILTRLLLAFLLTVSTSNLFAQHGNHADGTPLSEPGNAIFGTIQEVVNKLEADPNTDWSKVSLEALRQHLLDMKAFTEEVSVKSQKPIENGIRITIHPNSERAASALKRLFSMHPAMLKQETGWNMDAKQDGSAWIITCTTNVKTEIEKIRALGYIGLLAEGAHHQRHHWMIATGKMEMK